MDLEELSKAQIILLTLLVSFVTSIATGIVTVSLMQQSPPVVAQTVNRVIQETVQKVGATGQPAAAAVTTQPSVVSDSDLVTEAIEHADPSVVRIFSGPATSSGFIAIGVVLDDGSDTIATDYGALNGASDLSVMASDGTMVDATVTSRDEGDDIAYLNLATSSETWSPMTLSTSEPVLGEEVVALSGQTVPSVSEGIVEALQPLGASSTPQAILTSITASDILPGSPIIDENGDLVGISVGVSRNIDPAAFIDSSALKEFTDSQGTI